MRRPAGSARLAGEQASRGGEPAARGGSHHFPARILSGRILGAELQRPHRTHRNWMASIPGPRRRPKWGLRDGYRLPAPPPQLELTCPPRQAGPDHTTGVMTCSGESLYGYPSRNPGEAAMSTTGDRGGLPVVVIQSLEVETYAWRN